MCHTTGLHTAQIEKFVEQGMPQKIVKSVEYTIKKRVLQERKERDRDQVNAPTDTEEHDERGMATLDGAIHELQTLDLNCNVTEKAAVILKQDAAVDRNIPKMCGRFRQMRSPTAMRGHPKPESATVVATYTADMLAVGTQLTKRLAQRVQRCVGRMQKSKIYTLLTQTTQPAHIIAICILSFVLLAVGPELIDGPGAAATGAAKTVDAKRSMHTLAVIAYLGAFATHFGAQIWMTFVSGLSLYFSLPRHTFGQCQQILFPKYFALNAMLSVGMLVLFVKYFLGATWTTSTCVQLGALGMTAFIEVSVRLYLAPPMLRLMHEKYKIEGAIGSGQEVGSIVQGDLVQCPHYQRIHKAFRRIHMTIAMGNMAVLVATCVHLHFLASKIQIS